MGLPYFDRQSALMRLDRTICLYHGEPVFVQTDDERPRLRDIQLDENERAIAPPREQGPRQNEYMLRIYRLPVLQTSQPELVDYREPAFSYKAFPLGYINTIGHARYLTRQPMRQQRQGLTAGCITATPDRGMPGNWFTSHEMRDCILGVYPAMSTAEEMLNKYYASSVAISREVAIERVSGGGYALNYRGRSIGYKDGDRFRLVPTKEAKALRMILKDEKQICLH